MFLGILTKNKGSATTQSLIFYSVSAQLVHILLQFFVYLYNNKFEL